MELATWYGESCESTVYISQVVKEHNPRRSGVAPQGSIQTLIRGVIPVTKGSPAAQGMASLGSLTYHLVCLQPEVELLSKWRKPGAEEVCNAQVHREY
jgi:hypothetical protein